MIPGANQTKSLPNAVNGCGRLIDGGFLFRRVREATECRLQLVVQREEPRLRVDVPEQCKVVQLLHQFIRALLADEPKQRAVDELLAHRAQVGHQEEARRVRPRFLGELVEVQAFGDGAREQDVGEASL